MGLSIEEREALVALQREKVESILEQIDGLRQLGYWDNLTGRLYYATFHAVFALLIQDAHPVGSHKGSVIMFHQHYVKTGIFTKEEGAFYSQLQTLREKSDYSCSYYATEKSTTPLIEPTRQLIQKILKMLQ